MPAQENNAPFKQLPCCRALAQRRCVWVQVCLQISHVHACMHALFKWDVSMSAQNMCVGVCVCCMNNKMHVNILYACGCMPHIHSVVLFTRARQYGRVRYGENTGYIFYIYFISKCIYIYTMLYIVYLYGHGVR